MPSLPQRQPRRTSYPDASPGAAYRQTAPKPTTPTVEPAPQSTPAIDPNAVRLVLAIGETLYVVEPLDPGPDHSKAYRLVKVNGKAEVYDVARDHYGIVTCTCPHYTYRLQGNTSQPCKHGAALIRFGAVEAPRPVARDVWAEHDCHVWNSVEA